MPRSSASVGSRTSRLSARERAKRPQLVPRDTRLERPELPQLDRLAQNVALQDDDAAEAMARGGAADEWQMPEPPTDADVEAMPAPRPVAIPIRTPAPAPKAARQPITLRTVTYEDVDRLWDWTRDNPATAFKFFGKVHPHSYDMQQTVRGWLDLEAQGVALLRAIDISDANDTQHAGFVLLNPIVRTGAPPIGIAHCYLAPQVQGYLPQMLPQLLDIAAVSEPDLALMVRTDDYAFAKLLQPHGFTLQIALTRPPARTQG